jgi:glutathione S-transferase
MKLYYAAGTCSLSPHIVAVEAGIALELERVNIAKTPHMTGSGVDFTQINPNGYVPALELDDGSVLTEGVAIVQYLADLNPASGLMPPAGTIERVRVSSWLTFVATELHKMFSPWLFHPEYGTQAQEVARAKLRDRLTFVDKQLAAGGPLLMGERFTAADAYLFTIASWSRIAKVDVSGLPHLQSFMELVGKRPGVRQAMQAEGLKVSE